jgi:single-stranded-DNA-specific exonuclease
MSLGIECLLGTDPARCLAMASELNALNDERRSLEREMKQQAFAQVLREVPVTGALPHGLCVFDPGWHQGVIGIVAGRVKDLHHRPTVAFAHSGPGELKGSARSIPGVHIRDVLDTVAATCPGLLTRFGGHAMAAGLSLPTARLAEFSAAFDRVLAAQVDPVLFAPVVLSDGELATSDMTLELARLLAAAAPWGQAFPEPMFDGEFAIRQRRVVGSDHLRLDFERDGQVFQAIAFNAADAAWAATSVRRVRAAYRLSVNEWQGSERLQLVIVHADAC